MLAVVISWIMVVGQTPAPTSPPSAGDVVVRATGIGRPPPGRSGAQARLMAQRAAEVVAVRNLAAQLSGAGLAEPGQQVAAGPAGLIRGFRYLPARQLPDGSVEVTVELPLARLQTNHADLIRRLAQAEADLAEARAQLEDLRRQYEQLQAWVQQRLGAVEQELAELRKLLAAPTE
jgi:hypothetical protein